MKVGEAGEAVWGMQVKVWDLQAAISSDGFNGTPYTGGFRQEPAATKTREAMADVLGAERWTANFSNDGDASYPNST